MKHTAFFGDGEKTFALPSEQILELERKTGTGIGAIYTRTMTGQFQFGDIIEVIRLGLIGGGTSPKEAQTLVDAYARPTPIIEAFQLAADILEARWSGKVETETVSDLAPDPQDNLRRTGTSGDLAAVIRAAYIDLPDEGKAQ